MSENLANNDINYAIDFMMRRFRLYPEGELVTVSD